MEQPSLPALAHTPRGLAAARGLLLLALLAAPAAESRHAAAENAGAELRLPSRPLQDFGLVYPGMPPTIDLPAHALATPRNARLLNARIAFSTAPNLAARPFLINGAVGDQARAADCLAAAAYYEAGDDAVGQRAVVQVVLNRVRHPAFPQSVCGTVFQGSERRTGCQFTFTCDGAMANRRPSAAAWGRALLIAQGALSGQVEAAVGHATHYHTDWVLPYWSPKLDKIAEVHTHLFFRWPGWWGTPKAFSAAYAGAEPVIAKMAALSPFHLSATPVAIAAAVEPEAGPMAAAAPARLPAGPVVDLLPDHTAPPADDIFLVTLNAGTGPDSFLHTAMRTCGGRNYCKVLGWTDPARNPNRMPLPGSAIDALSFSYVRQSASGEGKALWNCAQFARQDARQCLRRGR